jgi:hypothetical protein
MDDNAGHIAFGAGGTGGAGSHDAGKSAQHQPCDFGTRARGAGRYGSSHDISPRVTVFIDALIRRVKGRPRLPLAVEVVPPSDEFVPNPRR